MSDSKPPRDPQTGAPLESLAAGFRDRTLVTAKMAAKLGMKAARRSFFGGPGKSASSAQHAEKDVAKAVALATEMVAQMGQLKGIVMKAGQMASYLPGAMPAEAQRVLSSLQAQSVAMSYERVAEAVTAELGGPPHEVFDAFEREPFAAASIGQVHRARLGDRAVAVKVQYPGIEELLTGDLDTLSLLGKLSTFGSAVDGGELVAELRARTLEECNYLAEAGHQRLFKQLLETHPGCHVPDVVPERSSRRVLTTALVEGALPFAEFEASAPQAIKDRAGQLIFDATMTCVFRHCAYNADPHPGNYLFHPNGDVTFLDFGCVRHFEAPFIDAWKTVASAIQGGDYDAFVQRFPALGMTPKPKRVDWDYQWRAMLHLYQPMRAHDPWFTFNPGYVAESYGVMVFDNPNKLVLAMPPEWLFLNRLQWGLFAVLAHLSATGPWPELFGAAIGSVTRPEPALSEERLGA